MFAYISHVMVVGFASIAIITAVMMKIPYCKGKKYCRSTLQTSFVQENFRSYRQSRKIYKQRLRLNKQTSHATLGDVNNNKLCFRIITLL